MEREAASRDHRLRTKTASDRWRTIRREVDRDRLARPPPIQQYRHVARRVLPRHRGAAGRGAVAVYRGRRPEGIFGRYHGLSCGRPPGPWPLDLGPLMPRHGGVFFVPAAPSASVSTATPA